jgi:O-methyltransferase involved in polyketide biosynthesis
LLPIDFTKSSLSEGLQSVNYFSREKKSTFIAEGLTMYLSEVEVKETLKSIRENSTKGSQFIFTYMEERSLGNHQFKNASWITSLWLKLKNENFTWGLNETALSQFLLDSQFHLTESKDHNNLREDFLSSLNQNSPLAIGENIAIAEVF